MDIRTPNSSTQKRTSIFFNKKVSPLKHWKNKRLQEVQLKKQKKSIFGDHYNYNYNNSLLNKEKKYMIEEERNTQIERANRILFEKIKKIGQRSAHYLKNKMQTEQLRDSFQEERIPYRTRKNLNTKKQTPFLTTQHYLGQSKVSQFNTPRRVFPTQTKILFKGHREIDGVNFAITIYIQGGMYIIFSEQGKMEHKIQMSLDSYHLLLKQSLGNNHKNIFQMLRFNGTLLELAGTKRQQINIIEEEQLMLPIVHKTPLNKYRSNTTN